MTVGSFYRPSGSWCQSDLLFPGASRSEARALLEITRLSSACWWIAAVCLHILLLRRLTTSVVHAKPNVRQQRKYLSPCHYLQMHIFSYIFSAVLCGRPVCVTIPSEETPTCALKFPQSLNHWIFYSFSVFFACQSASCSPFFLSFCVSVCSVVSDHLFTLHRNSLGIV